MRYFRNLITIQIHYITCKRFKNIIYIASILIGFWNIIISISKQSSLFLFKWFLWFIFILQLLLLPTLTIVIEDPLAHYKRTVDNVPYILGVFASITSQIGDVLTKEIESLFTLPDYLPYHNTGHVFASKLFKQMHQFKVRDANLKNNLSKFIQNCVVYDAMVGFKYSIGDLHFSELLSKIASSYRLMTGISKSGEEILKQEMLINAIGDATKHRVEELGHSQNYAAAKMLLQQRSSYNVVASVASQTLSSMKVVFEVICYSSFIFIPIVTLLPNGIRIISNYFCMLVWIQLWAPLYAVLNLLISISAKAKSIGIIGDSGLTMLTSVGYSNLHADIESMAGYLSMSIPFISYSIVKGGGGSIMNLANSLGSNYQSASGNVAQEIVSGNLSMGNIAYATSSHNNKSGFKHDTNFSHHAGRMEMGSDDGSVVFRTESGTIG
ncbi:MAG: conjugal transfer protein TraG, partial [Rickettsiales bacterium]